MKTIIHSVQIHASPETVYAALTTPKGLGDWWTRGGVRIDGSAGGTIRFTFQGDFGPEMKPTRLEPGRLVQWRCVGGHANWQDNTFTFGLEARNSDTMLKFVQEYAQELSDEVYGTYNFNWGYYLNSLKQLCEKGAGTPFVPPGS